MSSRNLSEVWVTTWNKIIHELLKEMVLPNDMVCTEVRGNSVMIYGISLYLFILVMFIVALRKKYTYRL